MQYKTVSNYNYATRKNQMCWACYSKKLKQGGDSNSFFNKKHSTATKAKLASIDKSYTKTKSFSDAVKKGMGDTPCGGDINDVWRKKHGEVEAARRRIETNKKLSIAFSGSKNPMYGKPAPQGSGNGWKGWFNDVHFRSLRELMFLIEMADKNIEKAESNKFAIEYIDPLGVTRTYFPDFFVDQILYEIKPKKLWNTPSVQCKAKAAELFCYKMGFKYVLCDPVIDRLAIQRLVAAGVIKWMGDYGKRFDAFLASVV